LPELLAARDQPEQVRALPEPLRAMARNACAFRGNTQLTFLGDISAQEEGLANKMIVPLTAEPAKGNGPVRPTRTCWWPPQLLHAAGGLRTSAGFGT
jgi:hypothetical protein